MSEHDKSNPALWLATYPSGQHGAILPAQDYLLCPVRKIKISLKAL